MFFRSWDSESLEALAQINKRVVRQTLFLTSNYFHNLMLVHASESPDVPVNYRGTIEAVHDAISSFVMLFRLLEGEARVWWVFNHRAFLEALCIGNVLREVESQEGSESVGRDALYARARSDICELPLSCYLCRVPVVYTSPFLLRAPLCGSAEVRLYAECDLLTCRSEDDRNHGDHGH